MSLSEFNKTFGITEDIEKEKIRFVQRINQTIFQDIHKNPEYPDQYESIFRMVCYGLGLNAGELISSANDTNYGYNTFIPNLKELTRNDFMETLKILHLVYMVLKSTNNKKMVDEWIETALAASTTDLGIRWKDGMFYPSGAKELDEKLIDDNLDWLNKFPEVKKQFSTALQHFKTSLSNTAARKDAITNSYSSMERLAQNILSNNENFKTNSNTLVTYLNLPKEYANILHYYKQIAHEYSSRHAGSECNHNETEAFIYLTGLLMRLMSK